MLMYTVLPQALYLDRRRSIEQMGSVEPGPETVYIRRFKTAP